MAHEWKSRDVVEAEKLLKKLLQPVFDEFGHRTYPPDVWEVMVEQFVWHVIQAAAQEGRGIVR